MSHALRVAAARFRQTGRTASTVVLAVTASTALTVWATGSEDAADTIKQQLTATVGEWNRGNLEGFIAPYAPESTFMTPEGPIGRSAMVERYREKYFAAGRPLQTLRFEELEARLIGTNHALMTGRFLLTGGGLPDQKGRFTLVWVRTGAGWRILHDHSS